MQVIHDHVTVCAVPPARYDQQQHETKHNKKKTRNFASPVLQYVVENTGLRAVTFRVDFSGSRNVILTDARSFSDTTRDPCTDGLTFECTVYPFERRVMVAVAKRAMRERAMIRVTYELLAEFEPDIGEITRALEQHAADLRELAITSHASYSFSHQHGRINARCSCSSSSWDQLIATEFCAEVNQHFSQHGDVWVDSTFPVPFNTGYMEPRTPTADYGQNSLDSGRSVPFSMCAWRPLHLFCDDERLWRVFQDPAAAAKATRSSPEHAPARHQLVPGEDAECARATTRVVSGLPGQQTFSCALAIVAVDIDRWKRSWFPLLGDLLSGPDSLDYIKKSVAAVPVRMCEGGVQWTSVVIDLLMPVFPLGNGLVAPRSIDGELWPALLHKAYAKLKGSYGAVANVSTVGILRELLGVPW